MYASERPAPTSASSTTPTQPLLLREPSAHVRVGAASCSGIRSRSGPRDLLDHVDLARDVAGAPGRDGDVPLVGDLEPEAARASRAARPAQRRARSRATPLGAEADDRPLRQARRARRRDRSCARRRDRRAAGSRARPRSRRGTGRRPSPSGSTRPCAARAARRCGGSRAARSSPPRAAPRSSSSVTSLSSPPMIAASATALLAVGDQEVVGLEPAQRAVERAQLLARRARAGRRCARPRASSRSNACSGLPQTCMT